MRVIPIVESFEIGPGRVDLISLEVRDFAMTLRFRGAGPAVLPRDPPIVERFTRILEANRLDEAQEYLRLHSFEWRDLLHGVGPYFGDTIDLTMSDDAGTNYVSVFSSAGGDGADLIVNFQVQPSLHPAATKPTITAYYIGRNWNEFDKDPIERSGYPSHRVTVDL